MKNKYLILATVFLMFHSGINFPQTNNHNSGNTIQYNFKTDRLILAGKKEVSSSREHTSEDEAEGYVYFAIAYLANPIMSVEINGKLSWGWTKEISLGFGELGQYRTSIEYTYLDREHSKNILRTAAKYDILLRPKINKKKDPVETSVLTLGGGYFTDFDRYGFFPEISYGYSYRDSRWLIYPSLKLRYTFVSNAPDLADLSLGLIFGFGNPFADYPHKSVKKKKSEILFFDFTTE